jgi:hypothetical protein
MSSRALASSAAGASWRVGQVDERVLLESARLQDADADLGRALGQCHILREHTGAGVVQRVHSSDAGQCDRRRQQQYADEHERQPRADAQVAKECHGRAPVGRESNDERTVQERGTAGRGCGNSCTRGGRAARDEATVGTCRGGESLNSTRGTGQFAAPQ